MKDPYKELKEDVTDEEKAIDETLERLLCVKDEFDLKNRSLLVEPAMGTYLMNFYNGIENILKRIAKTYYLTAHEGGSWHKELLSLSTNPPSEKIALFNKDIEEKLHAYRNFRHRFVSGYGFQLKAEKMLELIDNAKPLWFEIKKAIGDFWEKL